MRYKVADRVKIKSLKWYNENKDEFGTIIFSTDSGYYNFTEEDVRFCGQVVTIEYAENGCYLIAEDDRRYFWIDEMIEGLAEESLDNDMKEHQRMCDEIMDIQGIEPIEAEMEEVWYCPEGYIFKDENGNVINATKIVLEKKKKEYPKTYEECCKILGCKANHFFTDFSYNGCDVEISDYEDKIDDLLQTFRKLRYCRDAYWKIAGEEMGLGKPWEPGNNKVFGIIRQIGKIQKYHDFIGGSTILEFPTEEMRDAFKENFDPDIEICKEFL